MANNLSQSLSHNYARHFATMQVIFTGIYAKCERGSTVHAMETEFALQKAGGRGALAQLLGVATMTTYQPSWKPKLPPKHERYLQLLRPDWFIEWERSRKKQ